MRTKWKRARECSRLQSSSLSSGPQTAPEECGRGNTLFWWAEQACRNRYWVTPIHTVTKLPVSRSVHTVLCGNRKTALTLFSISLSQFWWTHSFTHEPNSLHCKLFLKGLPYNTVSPNDIHETVWKTERIFIALTSVHALIHFCFQHAFDFVQNRCSFLLLLYQTFVRLSSYKMIAWKKWWLHFKPEK